MIKILFAGGGSGGHLSPLLALNDSIKQEYSDIETKFVIAKGSIEEQLLSKRGITPFQIKVGKLRRYNQGLMKNIIDVRQQSLNVKDLIKTQMGLIETIQILNNFKPDIVFVKGGNAGLLTGLAAAIKKIPIYIHESDIVMGTTNRIIARWAKKIYVSWPINSITPNKYLDKFCYFGTPLEDRSLFTNVLKPDPVLNEYLLHIQHNNKFTLSVMGGSLGSKSLNQTIRTLLPQLAPHYNIMHLLGGNSEIDQDLSKKFPNYFQTNYLHNIADLLKNSQLAVARAGGSTIAELASFAVPTILVPLPVASKNHQKIQTDFLVKEKAVKVYYQDQPFDILLREINSIKSDNELRFDLARNFNRFSKSNASLNLARDLIYDYQNYHSLGKNNA